MKNEREGHIAQERMGFGREGTGIRKEAGMEGGLCRLWTPDGKR